MGAGGASEELYSTYQQQQQGSTIYAGRGVGARDDLRQQVRGGVGRRRGAGVMVLGADVSGCRVFWGWAGDMPSRQAEGHVCHSCKWFAMSPSSLCLLVP